MPETIKRHCPQCGRKAHDRLLVQCPDCHVSFVLDEQPAPTTLTPEHLQLLAAQVFGSWKFWAALLVVVGLAAWAIVTVADRVIDSRARAYMSTLEQNSTNRIRATVGQISNQIVAEFRQPRIQLAIEEAARQRANEIITNGVRPSLESLLDQMDAAAGQLLRSSNLLAQLERDALAAQKRIPTPAPAAPVEAQTTTNPPVASTPAPKTTPAASNNPAPDDGSLKLNLASQNITPAGNHYFVTLMFKPNSSTASGLVTMDVGTFNHTATVVNFSAVGSPADPIFNATGDAARLQFNVTPGLTPTVVVELSAPTIVRLSSDALVSDITIPIAWDKATLPTTSNKPPGNP